MKNVENSTVRRKEGGELDGDSRFGQLGRRRKPTIVSTGGLRSGSWAQADWIRSQSSSVSPNLVASVGRGGRSFFLTLIITAGSVWHDWNGREPVNTWPRDISRLYDCNGL
jgi:hypothetical protein